MTTAESLLHDALQLSPDDREWLALELASSLEKSPGYDEAWRAELARRWQSVLDGTARLYDQDEADELMFGPLDDE